MILTIAISTMKPGKAGLLKNLIEEMIPKVHSEILFLVISQNEDKDKIMNLNDRLLLIESSTTGLSRSRNLAIKHVLTDWLWFQDDDITLNYNNLNEIIEKQILSSKIDFVFGKVHSLENHGLPYKNYSYTRQHSRFNAFKISSIEILVRSHFLKNNNLSFCTKLGLGSELTCCEENLFLFNAFKKTERCYYHGLELSYHTTKLETRNFNHESNLKARGYLLGKIAEPWIWLVLLKWAFKFKEPNSFRDRVCLLHEGFILSRKG